MLFDPLYFVFLIPGVLLGLAASFYTKSTFSKYSKVAANSGMTGADAARRLLKFAGIGDVTVEEVGGVLSDHYDPTSKTLRLSPDVYGQCSLSAIGVACHEAGHAIQHARAYAFLTARTALVPVMNIANTSWMWICVASWVFHSLHLMLAGVVVFGLGAVFSLVTLPVEWDASARAKELMVDAGIVYPDEAEGAGQVLNAAFLTYVAALISAVLTFLYFLLRSGLLGGRNED